MEQKCRKYTSMISRYIHIEQFIYISTLLESIISICMGNFDHSAWELPYLLLFIQCTEAFSYSSGMVPVTAYFVSCCVHIFGTCEHFEILMKTAWDEAEEYQNEENSTRKSEMYLKLQKTLCAAIDAHVNLLEWVEQEIHDIHFATCALQFQQTVTTFIQKTSSRLTDWNVAK